MSYPGAQWHNQQSGGQYPNQYGPPPLQQQYPNQYAPQQAPQYGAPPPGQYGYSPQQAAPPYGYPPQQSPQQYGAPPLPQRYSPNPGYGPQISPTYGGGTSPRPGYGPPSPQPPPQQGYNGYPPQQGGPPPPGGYAPPHAPPSQVQAFGHGASSDTTFRYSQCTGRRKALLIGINYFGTSSALKGCINDVKNLSLYLNEYRGYKMEDMVRLTDDQQNPMSQPTKANIIRAMHWLVKDARPNDSLFFHYSGHGGQTEDLDGDEDDGFDEVIYPVDFKRAGHIVDDELHRIMVQPLQPGVRLTAIFDSCHSGSVLDLPFVYSTQGVLKEPNLGKEAAQGLMGMAMSYAKGDIGSVASGAMGLIKKVVKSNDVSDAQKQAKTSPADVVMWSGSKDVQTSADASIGGQASGAMSAAFVSALKRNNQQSYVQLLNSIRDELQGRYSQKPQLSCSHPLDTNLLFVM